jgi:hypothetical protein
VGSGPATSRSDDAAAWNACRSRPAATRIALTQLCTRNRWPRRGFTTSQRALIGVLITRRWLRRWFISNVRGYHRHGRLTCISCDQSSCVLTRTRTTALSPPRSSRTRAPSALSAGLLDPNPPRSDDETHRHAPDSVRSNAGLRQRSMDAIGRAIAAPLERPRHSVCDIRALRRRCLSPSAWPSR